MSGKGIDNSASQVPGNDGRYVIVITRWNEDIVTGLLKGATQALAAAGIEGEQVEVVSVPGAFEIPLACQAAAQRPDCDAVVALGTGKPVAFGVLTVDTLEQALERSADNEENKGAEAALSAVEMMNLLRTLRD